MCMMVYVAADQPLDVIPWDKAKPGFHVSELEPRESRVRMQFNAANIYYAGSHEGCGCGFQFGNSMEYEGSDHQLMRASLDAFAAYLDQQLKRVARIELFACWDGDQASAQEVRREITPEALRSQDFYFREKEFVRVTSNAA